MNHIYKTVWNAAMGTWTAVQETAKSHGKSSSSKAGRAGEQVVGVRFAFTLVASALLLASGQVMAVTGTEYNITPGDNICFYDATTQSVVCGDADTTVVNTINSNIPKSVAIGKSAKSDGESNVVVGASAQGQGTAATAFGAEAKALNNYGVAIGYEAIANNTWDISIGRRAGADAVATGDGRNIAIGDGALKNAKNANNNTVLGTSTGDSLNGSHNIAMGAYANSPTANNGTAITANNTIAIGERAVASSASSVAIGTRVKASGAISNAIGTSAEASGAYAIANGYGALASGKNAVAIGSAREQIDAKVKATGNNAIAIGSVRTEASGTSSIAIGEETKASGLNGVSLGKYAGQVASDATVAQLSQTVNIGYRAGYGAKRNIHGIAIGNGAGEAVDSESGQNVALGNAAGAQVKGNTNVAISARAGQNVEGHDNFAALVDAGRNIKGNNNIAIGKDAGRGVAATNTAPAVPLEVSNTIAMGFEAKGTHNDTIALGQKAKAQVEDSIAIGRGVTTELLQGDTQGNREGMIAIGSETTKASGKAAVAIGRNAQSIGRGAVTFGDASKAQSGQGIAIGAQANVAANSAGGIAMGSLSNSAAATAVAIGTLSDASVSHAVALGRDSQANRAALTPNATTSATATAAGNQVYALTQASQSDKDAISATVKGSLGAVSVGTTARTGSGNANIAAATRQITNVAAGSEDSDAVNVAQLKAVANQINQAAGTHYYSVKDQAGDAASASSNYNNNGATGSRSLAAGIESKATHTNATAVGGKHAKATAVQALALGADTLASGNSSIAIGGDDLDNLKQNSATYYNTLTGETITAGQYQDTTASADGAIAVGVQTQATGDLSTAVGVKSEASGLASVALGVGAKGQAEGGVALGAGAVVQRDAKTAVALGNKAVASANTSMALGTLAQADKEWSVALGAGSATASNATPETTATVGGITYSGFAGAGSVDAGRQVSVGRTGLERQIKHVAPGAINANSTDAINGSQLFATQTVIDKLASSTARNFGGGAAVQPDGSISAPTYTINGATYNDVGAALQAAVNAGGGAGTHYYSVKSTDTNPNSNYNNDGAKAIDSVAAGVRVEALRTNGVAIGVDVAAAGEESLAIGNNVIAGALLPKANPNESDKVDPAVNVKGATAVGNNSRATAVGAQAFGQSSKATALNAAAIGRLATASGERASAFGVGNTASGESSFSGGDRTVAAGKGAIAIGTWGNEADPRGNKSSRADAPYSVVVGAAAEANQHSDSAVVIGNQASAVGASASSTAKDSVAIGYRSAVTAASTIAVGSNAKANGKSQAIAVGFNSEAIGYQATAIGSGARVGDNGAGVALGQGASVTANFGTALGRGSSVTVIEGVALGSQSKATIAANQVGADPLGAVVGNTNNSTWTSTHGAVSVGDGTTITRQITSVAAGTNDTDAVNVAQLNTVANHTKNVGDSIVNVLGGDAEIANDGSGRITMGNTTPDGIGGTGETTIDAAIKAAAKATKVTSNDKSVTVTPDAANNAYDLAVNTDGTTIVKDPTTGALKANTVPITSAVAGQPNAGSVSVASGDEGKLATAGDIANAINNSGFTLTAAGANGSLVKPGATVDLKNTDGNIVVSKADTDNNVNFDLAPVVKIGPAAGGNQIIVNGNDGTISGLSGTLPATTSAAPTPTNAQAAPALTPVQSRNAATVGDVLNAGWNLQGNSTAKDFVRAYDTVNFVDGNGTTVTVDSDGVTSTIKVDVNAQGLAESAQLPVVYTKADGSKIYKHSDGNFYDAPNGGGAQVPTGDVIASMQNADGTTATPTTLANVKAGVNNNDAVNVSQLKGAADALGGGAAIDPNTGAFTAPSYTITKTDGSSYPVATNVGQALQDLNTEVIKPLVFAGDTGAEATRKLGEKLTVKGGATGTLTENNIGVEANGTDTLTVKLAEAINLGNNGSVQTGNTTVNNGGMTITGGANGPVSLSNAGLNNGGNKITNVANGTDPSDAVNFSQLQALSNAAKTHYYSVNDAGAQGGNYDNDGATGGNALAAGVDAQATHISSTAVGHNAKATNEAAVAIGWEAEASGNHSIALGGSSQGAAGHVKTQAQGDSSMAIGFGAQTGAGANWSIAQGDLAKVGKNAERSVAIGVHADVAEEANDAVALGNGAKAGDKFTVAIGLNAEATASGAMAQGNGAQATGQDSVAHGKDSQATGDFATAVGNSSRAGLQAAAVGNGANASGDYAVAFGTGSEASQGGAAALGNDAKAQAWAAVAVGRDAQATQTAAVAIGEGARATHEGSVALGKESETAVAVPTTQATVGGVTYDGFAGTAPTSTVSVGKAGAERTITNVAAGRIDANSTDAINGSQLHATQTVIGNVANTTVAALGGTSAIDPATGNITAGLDVGGNTYNNVQDALRAINTTASGGWNLRANGGPISNIAGPNNTVNVIDGSNTKVALNGNELKVDVVDNPTFSGPVTANGGLTAAGNLTAAPGTNVDMGNNVIHNVADGVADTDAVNVRQMRAMSGNITNITNQINAVDARVTQVDNRVTQVDNRVTNLSNRVDGIDGKIKDADKRVTDVANLVGENLTNPDGTKGLTVYDVAGQTRTDHTNVISALNQVKNEGTKYSHTRDNGEAPIIGPTNDSSAGALGSTAQGVNAIVEPDAENATAMGRRARVRNAAARSIAIGNEAVTGGASAVAVGDGAQALGEKSISIGTGNVVHAARSGAIGDPTTIIATATDSYSIGNNNTVNTADTFVMGNNVVTSVANSVYLGAGAAATAAPTAQTAGMASYNAQVVDGVTHHYAGGTPVGVVSVGDVGQERRVQNVAAGLVSPTSTDAINGSQLYQTNAAIGNLNNRINVNHDKAMGGIASAMASAGLPQAYLPGKSMIAMGVGAYQGRSAVAVGVSTISDNGRWIIKGSVNASNKGHVGATLGAGYQW